MLSTVATEILNKDYKLQGAVLENIIQQIVDGNTSIVGMMLESHLYEGNQPITDKRRIKIWGFCN